MEDPSVVKNTTELPLGVGKMQSKCSCKHSPSNSKTNSFYEPNRTRPRCLTWSTLAKLTLLLLLFLWVPGINCENQQEQSNQNETTGQVSDIGNDKRRPIDVGMDPLYFMTKGFLNLIQPLSSGFILDEADLVEDVTNGDFQLVLQSMADSDWKLWTQHYLGFVICAVFGVVFIVFMPIIGLCFCCCRCCGNCGGKANREEKRGDRCKRGACGSVLLLVLLIILAGMVCAFVTNELLREQTSQDEDHALLNRLTLEMTSIEMFKTNTVKDFKVKVIDSLHTTANNILNEIKNAARNAKDALGTITNSAALLNKALALAESASEINQTLTVVKEMTNTLIQDQSILSHNISDVKNSMLNTLASCSIAKCTELKTKVQSLSIGVDFTQVDDISQELSDVKQVLGNNLANLINEGKAQYDDIANKVQNDIRDELDQAKYKVDNISETVEGQVLQITNDLDKLDLNDTKAAIIQNQAVVAEYGNYRYLVGMVLCCVLLLVVLFGLLGLCFGMCGESAGEDAPACNRGVGATILMFGVALCFLFAWILMIVVLVLFLGGGLSYTEVCRYAIDIPNAPRPIQNTINELASQQLQQWEYNINVTDVIRDCKDNKAIFTSLRLNQFVNISDVLNMDNYNIDEKINELVTSVNVDLSNVVIFSNNTRKELLLLKNADLVNIDFNSYLTQLENPLTSENLATLMSELESAAADLDATDPGTADTLRSYAQILDTIQRSTVATMTAHRSQLSSGLRPLITAIIGPPSINDEIQGLVDTLDLAQKDIQENGTVLIRQFIESYGQKILDQLDTETQGIGYLIENDIGRCEPVYRSLTNIIDASCGALLNPFNGFWFSLGMSLFFLIPLIIISVVLVGLYRKTDEYYDDKSFDDVNYDAYNGVYPGDNIPLEENLYSRPRMY